jgi:CSLREA domain-containing protein
MIHTDSFISKIICKSPFLASYYGADRVKLPRAVDRLLIGIFFHKYLGGKAMIKILRIATPILAGCLLIGTILCLAKASNRAIAAASNSNYVGAIHVNTLEDELNTDGDCSLREAITAVNFNKSVDTCGTGDVLTDTILFDVMGTITVTSQLSITTGGPLVIDGEGVITISGGGSTRVLWVDPGGMVNLKRLEVADGYIHNDNGAGLFNNGGSLTINQCDFIGNRFTITDSIHYYGGGIYSLGGVLNVYDSRFDGNGSGDKYSHGGGIANINTTGQIFRTTFQNNSAEGCWQGIPCTHPGGGGYYQSNANITIQDSIFISNTAIYGGGGIYNHGGNLAIKNSTFSGNSNEYGGAMTNNGNVTISNSIFKGNDGTGIYTWRKTIISNTTFIGNEGSGIGNTGYLTITNSTFSGNQIGIVNYGTLAVDSSTFSDNSGTYGGGIYNQEYIRAISLFVNITNCTFSENKATEFGGGVYNNGLELSIINSTFSANSAAGGGGGIYNAASWMHPYSSTLTIVNTIIANSLAGGDCRADNPIIDGGQNISSDDSCGFSRANGSLPNTNPLLGPLQDNGGPTLTHALLWGSPAIDAGDNTKCPSIDQRGIMRPLDGNGDGKAICDIGSYEVNQLLYPLNPLFLPLVRKTP